MEIVIAKATLWVKAQHEGALPPRALSTKTRGFHTQPDQGQGSLVGCRLWGCTELVGHDWSDLAAAAAAVCVPKRF